MKKSLTISCLLLFVFLSVLNVLAQEKTITEQEFFDLGNKADQILENSTYRKKITSKSFINKNDSEPDSVEITTYEKNSDGYRKIVEIKSAGTNARTEEIKIGDQKFIRKNNEKWRKALPEDRAIGVIMRGETEGEKSFEYKYLGEVEINKQKADLYEMKGFVKYNSADSERTNHILDRFWFDKQGRKLKVERLREINGKITPFVIFEYEYDPNMKIEAPIK